MHVGIEGTTPGVEQGKEMSLSVEEQSSPKSHEVWVDADIPQPVTYVLQLVMLKRQKLCTLVTRPDIVS